MEMVPFVDGSGDVSLISVGDSLEVEWPCEQAGSEDVYKLWFPVIVIAVRQGKRWPRFMLRFGDGEEAEHSLRDLRCRSFRASDQSGAGEKQLDADKVATTSGHLSAPPGETCRDEEVLDKTGFVHQFELQHDLVDFCDWLHEHKEVYGDKTRGDAAYGEPLHGGITSVLVRREALPPPQKDLYNQLHHRCIEQVPIAWPGWLRKAGGKDAKARPSQDLRLLQYSSGAQFKAHVDSAWPCQALIYLNEDFCGGSTAFPNLKIFTMSFLLMFRLMGSCIAGVERLRIDGSLDPGFYSWPSL